MPSLLSGPDAQNPPSKWLWPSPSPILVPSTQPAARRPVLPRRCHPHERSGDSTADKLAILSVSKHPEPVATTVPMVQVVAEKSACLIGRAYASKSRHHSGITMHAA